MNIESLRSVFRPAGKEMAGRRCGASARAIDAVQRFGKPTEGGLRGSLGVVATGLRCANIAAPAAPCQKTPEAVSAVQYSSNVL